MTNTVPNPAGRISASTLFVVFLRIGCLGFGGLGSVLALIERELVTHRGLLRAEDVTEALTYTKLLPGSTVVQVVSYIGWKLGVWKGSAAATIAFVLPAFVVMLLLSIAYLQVRDIPSVKAAIHGINAAVVGLLAVAMYKLATSAVKNWFGFVVAGTALSVVVFFRAPIVLVVVAAGLLRLAVRAAQPRAQE